ncbi:MAG: hypothetical protein KDK65_01205 [Chlamydiia bacterium]|nr:hypothetical protein [Chlamydiia bacterium]
MIPITPHQAILLYLLFTLSSILFLWLRFSHKPKQPPRLSQLHTCEYCRTIYQHPTHKSVTRCPNCNCLNKL